MARGMTEFSAQVSDEDYQEFVSIFTGTGGKALYGASSWFIRTALSNFLEEVRKDDTLAEKARQAVARMVEDNRE